MEKVDERNTVLKVVITGPESTGKTTLAEALAQHFKTGYVAEYARTYLENKQGNYLEGDLLTIARGQISCEDEFQLGGRPLIICDTSLEVLRIWSELKYGKCDPFIKAQALLRRPDLFLLLKPDFPWQPDPLRENQHNRDELFTYYQKSLREYGAKVVGIGGNESEHIHSATDAIDKMMAG
jgi:NadR type nicotinamide-nucleotide adenylyltransferase